MNTGWAQRLSILKIEAETKFLGILRTHEWEAIIDREVEKGEYLIIAAERGGHKHFIAFLYTSATDNAIYKELEKQVEHVFFNGQPYKLESFIYGIKVPVSPADDFFNLLLKWNEDSSIGKFSPGIKNDILINSDIQSKSLMLLSEEPIEAIWLRVRQLQSVTLAKKMILERAQREKFSIDNDTAFLKAEGIAYALRNAFDSFQAGKTLNLNQRILNVYYGSLSFPFAEMLSSPKGSKTLSEIESFTKQGHGLYTIDGLNEGFQQIVVGVISSGFFSEWMKFMGIKNNNIPAKKPRKYENLNILPPYSWLSVEQLFACIPEISDLFADIFDSAPRYVMPSYDSKANLLHHGKKKPEKTYVQFIDKTNRLKKEDIAQFPGPISDILVIANGFRVAIDHMGKKAWYESLSLHRSPFVQSSIILPIFNELNEYRAICVVLLYALSIVVRYRPSIWRRVQEGDLDHMRVLIEAFLVVAERVLPEQFLHKIIGYPISVKQPGSFF